MSVQVHPKDFSASTYISSKDAFWTLAQSTMVRNGRIEIYLANQRISPKQFHDVFLPWLADNLSEKVHEARSGCSSSKYISCSLDISGNSELSSEPRVLKALLQLLSKHRVAPTVLKLYRMNLDDKHVTVLCDYMNSDMPKELPISELHLSHNQLTCDGAWRLMEVAFECGHYPPKQENSKSLWLRVEKNFPVASEAHLLRKAADIGLAIGTKENPLDQCTVTMPHFFVAESSGAKGSKTVAKAPKGKGKGKKSKNGTSQWYACSDWRGSEAYERNGAQQSYPIKSAPSAKGGQLSAKSTQLSVKSGPPSGKGPPLKSAQSSTESAHSFTDNAQLSAKSWQPTAQSEQPSAKSEPLIRSEPSKSEQPSAKRAHLPTKNDQPSAKSEHPSVGSTTPAQIAYNYVQASTANVVLERHDFAKAMEPKAVPTTKASVAVPSTKARSSAVPMPKPQIAMPSATSKASGIKADRASPHDEGPKAASIPSITDLDFRVSSMPSTGADVDFRVSVPARADRPSKDTALSPSPRRRARHGRAKANRRERSGSRETRLRKKRSLSDVASPKNRIPPSSLARTSMLQERLILIKSRHQKSKSPVVVVDERDDVTMIDGVCAASPTIEIDDNGSDHSVSACSLKQEKFSGHDADEAKWYDDCGEENAGPQIDETREMPSFYALNPTSKVSSMTGAGTGHATNLSLAKPSPSSSSAEAEKQHEKQSARILSTNSLLEAHYGTVVPPQDIAGPVSEVIDPVEPLEGDSLLEAHYAQKMPKPTVSATSDNAPASKSESFHLELLGLL